jgi:hypothetical protein
MSSWIISGAALLLAFGCLGWVVRGEANEDAKIAGLLSMVLLVLIAAAAAAVQAKV